MFYGGGWVKYRKQVSQLTQPLLFDCAQITQVIFFDVYLQNDNPHPFDNKFLQDLEKLFLYFILQDYIRCGVASQASKDIFLTGKN